jgi:MerR family copper efflux transcriptional regulator
MGTMTIGQLAQAAGVGVETVRFYEREGLLAEPPRRASGYRQYPEAAVARVQFIRHAKELGFSLKEIGELLELRLARGVSCAAVQRRAMAKIEDIEARIAALRRMKRALAKLAATCGDRGAASECPILEALEAGRR